MFDFSNFTQGVVCCGAYGRVNRAFGPVVKDADALIRNASKEGFLILSKWLY